MTVVENHIAWIRKDIEALLDEAFKLTASAPSDGEIERLRREIRYLEGLIVHYKTAGLVTDSTAPVNEAAEHTQRVVTVLRRTNS